MKRRVLSIAAMAVLFVTSPAFADEVEVEAVPASTESDIAPVPVEDEAPTPQWWEVALSSDEHTGPCECQQGDPLCACIEIPDQREERRSFTMPAVSETVLLWMDAVASL